MFFTRYPTMSFCYCNDRFFMRCLLIYCLASTDQLKKSFNVIVVFLLNQPSKAIRNKKNYQANFSFNLLNCNCVFSGRVRI